MSIQNPPAPVEQTAAVAKPATQAEKVAALEKFLGARIKSVETLLAKAAGMTPEKFIRTVVFAAQKNPDLLSCTRQSLFLAALDAAILGLPVGTSQNLAYLIPYRNKDTKQLEASFQVDYKGLIALMLETGDVEKVELHAVYEKDDFEAVVGSPRPTHRIYHKGPRGAALGYYAVVTLKGGSTKWDFMTRDQVEQVRKTYADEKSPAWRDSYDEQGKKTIFRRVAKTMRRIGPAHERLARAIEADARSEAGDPHEPSQEVLEITGEVVTPTTPALDAPADEPALKAPERAKAAVLEKAAKIAEGKPAAATVGA